jgi:hypothetical protein
MCHNMMDLVTLPNLVVHTCFIFQIKLPTEYVGLVLIRDKNLFASRGQYKCQGRCPRKVCRSILKVPSETCRMAIKASGF